VDAAEDERYGKGQRGDELPAELARRESRLAKLQTAKAELEAEAKQEAEAKKAAAQSLRPLSEFNKERANVNETKPLSSL
jgi:hypothetical protein